MSDTPVDRLRRQHTRTIIKPPNATADQKRYIRILLDRKPVSESSRAAIIQQLPTLSAYWAHVLIDVLKGM